MDGPTSTRHDGWCDGDATATRRRRKAAMEGATAMEGVTALEGATAMDGTTVTAMAMVEMDNVA